MLALNNTLLDSEPATNFTVSIFEGTGRNYSGFATNATSVEGTFTGVSSGLTQAARQFMLKLDTFKTLQPNWDKYGAIPPSVETIDRAKSFIQQADKNLLPFYFTAPGPNGEISIEFKQGLKEASVYINADGSMELVLNEGENFILEGSLDENYKDLLLFIHG